MKISQKDLFCRTLLPEDAVLSVVGGPGKEFWAAGKNWKIDTGTLAEEHLAMMGRWRVEVVPGTERTGDVFLHILHVGDRTLKDMDRAELIRSAGRVGVRFRMGAQSGELLFNTAGDVGGRIRLTAENSLVDTELTNTVMPQKGI